MDLTNALFELLGAVLIVPTLVRAWRLREVVGVHPATPVLFLGWGAWNVLYYPSLGQYWSLLAGLVVVASNVAWVATVLLLTRSGR